MIEGHLDALLAAGVAAVVTGLGGLIVHMKAVAKMQANLREVRVDTKELKRLISRGSRRFHYLNHFSMVLYAAIQKIAAKQDISLPDTKGYDFASENREDNENEENGD